MNEHAGIITWFLLAVCCCTLLVPPLDANVGGYTVGPVPPGAEPGTPVETVELQFWQLTIYDLAIIAALSLSPALLFPLELLFILKLFAYLGFRKVAPKNVLDHPSRSTVYSFIRNNPGTDFSEIARKTGITPGSLRYHLALLKFMNKVTVLTTNRNSRYFENSGLYSVTEQRVLKFLHNEPSRNILALLMKCPDMTRVELELALGISGAGVNWHLHRFSKEGILTIAKDGRNARYTINPEIIPFLEKHLAENSGHLVSPDAVPA